MEVPGIDLAISWSVVRHVDQPGGLYYNVFIDIVFKNILYIIQAFKYYLNTNVNIVIKN